MTLKKSYSIFNIIVYYILFYVIIASIIDGSVGQLHQIWVSSCHKKLLSIAARKRFCFKLLLKVFCLSKFRAIVRRAAIFSALSPTDTTPDNAVNLAFLMGNLSQALLKPYRQHDPDFSIRDLKAQFRARRYLVETIKMLPEMPQVMVASSHTTTTIGSGFFSLH